MFIRKWITALFPIAFLFLATWAAKAQEPEFYVAALNPVRNIYSLYQPKTRSTLIGIFNQNVGAYQKYPSRLNLQTNRPALPGSWKL